MGSVCGRGAQLRHKLNVLTVVRMFRSVWAVLRDWEDGHRPGLEDWPRAIWESFVFAVDVDRLAMQKPGINRRIVDEVFVPKVIGAGNKKWT